MLPPLTHWETFYVILGSSGAALTGLMFVVIALRSEARTKSGPAEVGAFATPTVVHFSTVLLISGILTMPGHSAASLSYCLTFIGIAGLTYTILILRQVRRQTGYSPVLEDWVWHVTLPIVAYASVLVVGAMVALYPEPGLHLIGATTLLLLFIGIHNAWDAAVWLTSKRNEE